MDNNPTTPKKAKEKVKENGNGSGTVYQRGSRWCWQLTVYQGLKRVTVSGTCNNRTEARAELAKAIAKRENGGLVAPDKMTLGEWLDKWLEGKKANLSPSTYVGYENHVRVHLKPDLGHIRLQALKPVHLKTFYSDLAKKPVRLSGRGKRKAGTPHPTKLLSAKTQAYTHAVLHGALEEAYKLELIHRNPSDIVKPEAKEEARNHKASTAWTAEEAATFLAFAKGNKFYEMFYILLSLGLRRGEMLGIRWSNIDLVNGRMKIVETVNSVAGKIVIGTPKTQKSKRTLKLPSDVVDVLLAHKEKQKLEHSSLGIRPEKDFVFTSLVGTPINPHKIDDVFNSIISAASLRRIRVHDLRHTHASLARRQGVSLEVVSERLGHSRSSFTADVYRHTFEDEMDAGAIPLSQLLAPRGGLPN
jgi:integrase